MSAIVEDLQRHRSGHVDVAQGLFNVAQFEILAALSNDTPLHMPLNREPLPPTPDSPVLR